MQVILHYVSDIHLEMRKKMFQLPTPSKVPGTVHHLALLGDIGSCRKNNLEIFLHQVAAQFDQVLYVLGNHEYYNLEDMSHALQLTVPSNVHVLNNDVIVLDGVTYLGTTLWSHIPKSMKADITYAINDYEHIRHKQRKITPDDTNRFNKEAIQFIQRHATQPCVVLTHHAPLFSTPDYPLADLKYINSPNNVAFHNDLDDIIHPPIMAWLFGHTHYSTAFLHNDVIIASNAVGYASEQTHYSPDATIIIK